MLHLLLQLQPAGLPTIPELPPGPSLDRVRGPVEIPFLETWQIALIILISFLVIGLLGWWLFRNFSGQAKQTPSSSPDESAIAELKSAAKLAANDDERFAILSSLALRRYFETGKGIHALGKTTDEFLKSLADHSILNVDARKSLAECLQHCDQVKFARKSLVESERDKLTESALALIQHCEATQPTGKTSNAQP